jgi:hypothetical protein
MKPVLTARATAPTSTCVAPVPVDARGADGGADRALGGVVAPFGGFDGDPDLDAIR